MIFNKLYEKNIFKNHKNNLNCTTTNTEEILFENELINELNKPKLRESTMLKVINDNFKDCNVYMSNIENNKIFKKLSILHEIYEFS